MVELIGNTTCAILDNGDLRCWGSNSSGQLGQGHREDLGDDPDETGDNLPPVDLGAGRTATDIGGNGVSACVVLDNGALFCLPITGRKSDYERVGDDRDPMPLGAGRTAVATGRWNWVLLDNGALKIWSKGYGRRGIGSSLSAGELDGTGPAADLGTPPTSAVLPSLTSGTNYLVRVSAVNEFGVGLPSPAQEVIAP